MSGHMAATAPHLDGSEDIGVWFDVAWASFMHVSMQAGGSGASMDAIDDAYEGLSERLTEDGKPTPEEWGASEAAQRGQAAMFAMFGATPDMGAAPSVGNEG